MENLYPSYETERLILKPSDLEDIQFFLELLNTPKWLQNIGDRNVKTDSDAEKYISEKIVPDFEKRGFGNYTIIRKEDKVKIGSCGLYDREGLVGVDIGFALLPKYEKKGYAYESASRILSFGFEDFGLSRIQGITLRENVDSRQLLEKLGLTFEKIVRLPNDTSDLMLYSITAP